MLKHYESLINCFDEQVRARLGHYVYRLIDPRHGETFYVGVGQNTRVLDHVLAAVTASSAAPAAALEGINSDRTEEEKEDAIDLKLDRIRDIHLTGLEVIHVIHRHGIPNREAALIVEAALIDAYPGLSNRQLGHGSGDFGCRSLLEIINEERMETFRLDTDDKFILINIGRSLDGDTKNVLESTRYAWRAKLDRAMKFDTVIAHSNGVVRGVFVVDEWLPATVENFPASQSDMPGRIGFVGREAEDRLKARFLNKLVPSELRPRGAANPFRYVKN